MARRVRDAAIRRSREARPRHSASTRGGPDSPSTASSWERRDAVEALVPDSEPDDIVRSRSEGGEPVPVQVVGRRPHARGSVHGSRCRRSDGRARGAGGIRSLHALADEPPTAHTVEPGSSCSRSATTARSCSLWDKRAGREVVAEGATRANELPALPGRAGARGGLERARHLRERALRLGWRVAVAVSSRRGRCGRRDGVSATVTASRSLVQDITPGRTTCREVTGRPGWTGRSGRRC